MRRGLSRAVWSLAALLLASCEEPPAGAPAGAVCGAASECASARCELLRCVTPCASAADCPAALPACATLAGELLCLPVGELRLTRALAPAPAAGAGADAGAGAGAGADAGAVAPVEVEVPSHASGLALLVRGGGADLAQLAEVTGPDGARVAAAGDDTTAVRYQPSPGASALVLPQSPELPLLPGRYLVRASAGAAGGSLEVRYLLGPPPASPRLHLHLHFVGLAGACWPTSEGTLDAARATQSVGFRALLDEARRVLGQVPIRIGDITYQDLAPDARWDPLLLTSGRTTPAFGALLSTGSAPDGDHALDVFFIKSFDPSAVAALSSSVPGPLDAHGTPSSGTVVALSPLCGGLTPKDLGRLLAHELAHLLGLFHNEEADGTQDTIADTPMGPQNLMYWSPTAIELTPGQRFVLLRNPTLDGR
ncbi:MAG: hypothetical protein IT370_04310 [Deltaproteobacteria bacterium]|nr:hypothetical protein [Deltaproteobacteria bacterium]